MGRSQTQLELIDSGHAIFFISEHNHTAGVVSAARFCLRRLGVRTMASLVGELQPSDDSKPVAQGPCGTPEHMQDTADDPDTGSEETPNLQQMFKEGSALIGTHRCAAKGCRGVLPHLQTYESRVALHNSGMKWCIFV